MYDNSLGIYIHVPFCISKCPYCDFYSVIPENFESYTNSVCKEIEKWGKKSDKIVNTIYFGGGTPSLLSCNVIGRIIECIHENFNVLNPEITMEVNPADYAFVDFQELKNFGLNRVSLGAQSVCDEELKKLGRRHKKNDIVMTLNSLRKANIDNISLDLMLGIPMQTIDSIEKFINFCKMNEIKHISAYLLKIEKGTKFYANREKLSLPNDDESADIYEYTVKYLEHNGYCQYEISNFSIPGFESRHNLKYWNLEEYIGIGPSAHSLFEGKRFYYKNSLRDFLIKPEICFEGNCDSLEEYSMLRLRLTDGLNANLYKEKFGTDIPEAYFQRAKKYVCAGLVNVDKGGICLTKKGFLLSNTIIGEILG